MTDNRKVEIETTSMPCNSSLTKLCEQYDQEMANVEVDLDIYGKLIKLVREHRATNEQQLSSAHKSMEKINKELQLLDETTNDLIEGTISQGEKIEQLKLLQKQIISGIRDAENSLLGSENTARDDLEKLNSVKRNVQKFLENNLAPPVFSDAALKLENYQKTFSSKVHESIDHLASLKSITDEADQLKNLEKVLKEMRMDAVNLERKISEVDTQCLFHHKKIVKSNASKEEEKQRRNVVSEKYKQHKDRIVELTLALESNENDKRLLSERLNSAKQELIRSKERLEMKRNDAKITQEEVDRMKEELAKLEKTMKLEQEKHEQKVQEMKEAHEADIYASKALLMALREKESAVRMQIQKARDDLNKKAEWEAHKKINEEAERNLEQLKKERAQLQVGVDEKESLHNSQLFKMDALKAAFQENKLEAWKKREILMSEVKRLSEEILGLKHRIAEEERRFEAKRNKMDKQLMIATTGKNIGELVHCAGQDRNFRQHDETLSCKSFSANEGSVQKQRSVESDEKEKVEKNDESDNDIKTENSTEEIVVEKTDSLTLFPEKKLTEDEKLIPKFSVSEIKKSSLCTERNGGQEAMSQPITKFHVVKCDKIKNLPSSDTLPSGQGASQANRQARKKRVPAEQKKAHNSALALFDSDVSVSTIKPIYASTPLLQKKDESSFCGDPVGETQKKRGRPRGKKAYKRSLGKNDNSKTAKKKDAYDLDSDFD